MAIAFNEETVVPQPFVTGVTRQRLVTDERVKGTRVLLDRLTLAAGATMRFDIPAKSLAWFQMLEGEATLSAMYTDWMSDSHSVFLPPGYNATLSTAKGASFLYAEIPDAGPLDPGFSANSPLFMVINWRREPVYASEHDARKRISLVTPLICRTAAIKIEMVIYPAGNTAPNYHHEGAETFIYVLSGRGTAWANEQPFSVRQGDLLYFPDRERHHLKADDAGELRFLEMYVPGEFETVWADETKISAWRSTGLDINGRETQHDERERIAFRYIFGSPFTR